jgi:hypothetical protein
MTFWLNSLVLKNDIPNSSSSSSSCYFISLHPMKNNWLCIYIYTCVCVLLIFHKSASPNPQAEPWLQRRWPRIGLIPMVPLCLWRSTRPRSVGPGGGWSMSMWYDLGMLVNAWIGNDISIYGWLVVWNMNFISPNSWDDDPIWRTHIFQGLGIKWGYPQMVGLYWKTIFIIYRRIENLLSLIYVHKQYINKCDILFQLYNMLYK